MKIKKNGTQTVYISGILVSLVIRQRLMREYAAEHKMRVVRNEIV